MTGTRNSTGFTWDPDRYGKSSSFQQKMAEELIAKMDLRGNERVLDIGCGDGKVTAAIACRLPEGSVVGIDSSNAMIRFASGHFPKDTYPNLSFACMDARDLACDGMFDRVFSNAALHWIMEQQQVLSGTFRALVPGGRLQVQLGGRGNASEVLAVLSGIIESPRWRKYFHGFSFTYGFFSDDQYRIFLRNAGLEPIRVELIPREMVHRTTGDLAGWIATTWLPWLEQVPLRGREAFVQEIVDQYVRKHPADRHGAIRVGMVRLEAEAVRPFS